MKSIIHLSPFSHRGLQSAHPYCPSRAPLGDPVITTFQFYRPPKRFRLCKACIPRLQLHGAGETPRAPRPLSLSLVWTSNLNWRPKYGPKSPEYTFSLEYWNGKSWRRAGAAGGPRRERDCIDTGNIRLLTPFSMTARNSGLVLMFLRSNSKHFLMGESRSRCVWIRSLLRREAWEPKIITCED